VLHHDRVLGRKTSKETNVPKALLCGQKTSE